MKAILLVSAWPTANFWTFLFPDGKQAHEFVVKVRLIQPYIVRGKFCENKLLQGRMDFPFLAAYIQSPGTGYRHRAGRVKNPMKTKK